MWHRIFISFRLLLCILIGLFLVSYPPYRLGLFIATSSGLEPKDDQMVYWAFGLLIILIPSIFIYALVTWIRWIVTGKV